MKFLDSIRAAHGLAPTTTKGYLGQVDTDFFVRALTLKEAFANWGGTQVGDVGASYGNDAIVYAAIRACAQNVAQVPFLMYKGKDRDPKPLDASPWYPLFEKPNPELSRYQLWEATETYLKLRGECIWLFEFGGAYMNGTIPTEIYPMDPKSFRHVIDDETKLIVAWEYSDERGRKTLFEQGVEILHFKKFNPYDRYRGLSPLQAAAIAIRMGGSARNYNAVTLQNMGEPGGILSTEARLDQAQVQNLREQFESRHQGPNKAKRVAVLHSGLSYEQVGLTPRDMEFKEVMNMSVEDILAVLGVPKTEIFRYDDVRKETAEVQDRALWTKNLVPEMAYIEDILWSNVFSQRGDRQTYGLFDKSTIPALREDDKAKAEAAKIYFEMGYPINMLNERFNLGMEEVEWGDTGFLPMNLVPVDQVLNPTEEPVDNVNPALPPPDDEEDDAKAIATRQSLLTDTKGARRRAGALAFQRRLRPLEARFAHALKKFFFSMRQDIIEVYMSETRGISAMIVQKDSMLNKMSLIIAKHRGKLKAVAEPHVKAAIKEGADRLSDFGIAFNITNPQAHELLGERTGKITRITRTIEVQIRRQITSGYEENETVLQIADRLRNVFNFASSRSMTIARTEMSNAANQSGVLAEKNAGILRHEWATAGDEAVRDSHVAVDGEVVPVDSNFSNGLAFPGDPSGAAEEVINCRCTTIPVFDDEA